MDDGEELTAAEVRDQENAMRRGRGRKGKANGRMTRLKVVRGHDDVQALDAGASSEIVSLIIPILSTENHAHSRTS
jgi:hypothetical protein